MCVMADAERDWRWSLANQTISAQRSPPTSENLKQCAMARGSLISNLKIMSLISIGKWAKVLPDEEARADKLKEC